MKNLKKMDLNAMLRRIERDAPLDEGKTLTVHDCLNSKFLERWVLMAPGIGMGFVRQFVACVAEAGIDFEKERQANDARLKVDSRTIQYVTEKLKGPLPDVRHHAISSLGLSPSTRRAVSRAFGEKAFKNDRKIRELYGPAFITTLIDEPKTTMTQVREIRTALKARGEEWPPLKVQIKQQP